MFYADEFSVGTTVVDWDMKDALFVKWDDGLLYLVTYANGGKLVSADDLDFQQKAAKSRKESSHLRFRMTPYQNAEKAIALVEYIYSSDRKR